MDGVTGVAPMPPGIIVAVGTVLADGPRADPSERNYRTGLLSWVPGGEPRFRPGMPDLGRWQVAPGQAGHPLPGDPAFLAAARQREPPVPGDVVPEGLHCLRVSGDGVVRLVSPD